MQMKVLARTMAKEVAVKRMECEKRDSMDGSCLLEGCEVCAIDICVERLDDELINFCGPKRGYDSLNKALSLFEDCCCKGKQNPLVLISNDRWPANVLKLSLELLRVQLETLGATGDLEVVDFFKLMSMLTYATEDIVGKNTILAKFNFEILNEDEDKLEIIPVVDFFSDEETDFYMMAATCTFRASFGVKQIPSKAVTWDGRRSSAEEIRMSKGEDRNDCYLIKFPCGKEIGKQVKCEGIFDVRNDAIYAIQPEEIDDNNSNAHLRLVPNRRAIGSRLIVL